MKIISARQALTSRGWMNDVTLTIDDNGLISDIATTSDSSRAHHVVGVLLPGMSNVHSHSFQRAMAGLAENTGGVPDNDFWSWRQVMYRFLELLTPEDIGSIAAQVQMEMLESGYCSQAEFHYLHHAPGGRHYGTPDELSLRHLDAAYLTGIGYTHLPVLYMQGGLDGRKLQGGQIRFGCSLDTFQALYSRIADSFKATPADFCLGIAPHSLRAVPPQGIEACLQLNPAGPFHMHAAEQVGEVAEVMQFLKARPVQWILDNCPVDGRWCFIHATHLDDREVAQLARSGATAGLCPLTEANLGDGTFRAREYTSMNGAIGIGSDSNIRITLAEELRQLETSQRLHFKRRLILTDDATPSNGRFLFDRAARGGAQAIGRNAGRIETGAWADLVALDDKHGALCGLSGDAVLDAWIFSCSREAVSEVWAAGRHVVSNGQHVRHRMIQQAFNKTVKRLRKSL